MFSLAPLVGFFQSKLGQAIIILALLAACIFGATSYLHSVRESGITEGMNKENAVWVEREAKRIKERDAKIVGLENLARLMADRSATDTKDAATKIEGLNKKLRSVGINSNVYTIDNVAIRCAQPTGIYLGSEFSAQWNKYNEVLK